MTTTSTAPLDHGPADAWDAIVIGVGAMGAATCLHLARRGLRVLGLDRHAIPNARGSSHGDTRMIRLCYFEHPDYVPLLHGAYAAWRALERDSGRALLDETGGLYCGPHDGFCLVGSLRAAEAHDLPHERLDRAALRGRFPQFTLPDDYEAVWEPRAGYLRPELAIGTCVELALHAGAEIHGHEPAQAWEAGDGGVTVRTPRGTYRAARLVLCGGAWNPALLPGLGAAMTVTRQPLGWVWPRRPDAFRRGTMPVWAIDHPDGTLHYGFPMVPGRPGFKLGHHKPGPAGDPDTIDFDPRPEDEATFRDVLRRYLPDADGPVLSMAVCMYTNTPDGHFLIDRHPVHERVTVVAGFSGHGFKFASLVGEIAADLAVDGTTRWPVGFLGAARLR